MKIAYIITAYKNPSQLQRLIKSLYFKDISFYIHVDKKATIQLFKNELSKLPPYYQINWIKREHVHWGGIGLVKALVNGLSDVLKIEPSVDYIIFLSEKDYPIKRVTEINAFLEENCGMSYMNYFLLPYSGWPNGGMDRIQNYHFRILGKRYQFPHYRRVESLTQKFLCLLFRIRFSKTRIYPENLKPYGGSSWWCISLKSAQYVLNFLAKRPEYIKFHKYTHAPDEGFFQTILLNSSQVSNSIINESLHFVEWTGEAHPRTFTRDDFPKLIKSSKLYARKFDFEQDSTILDLIDENLLKKVKPLQ